jgi:hypothetical protein
LTNAYIPYSSVSPLNTDCIAGWNVCCPKSLTAFGMETLMAKTAQFICTDLRVILLAII